MKKLLLALCFTSLLGGCPTAPKVPQGALEIIESAEITARGIQSEVVQLTCTKFEVVKDKSPMSTPGRCLEVGKPLLPSVAIVYHDKVESARNMMKQAVNIGAGGVGNCGDKQLSQAACVEAARLLLNDLERTVIQIRTKQ